MRFNRVLPFLPFLAACATPADEYPSLALRDAERVTGTMEPADPAPDAPAPTGAAVLDRIGQLTAEAAGAHQAFLAAAPQARGAVAEGGGAPEGSDAWARAQVALAALESARSRTATALADLDRLYVDASVAGAALDRIGAARDVVAAQVEEQDRVIAALSGSLR